MSCEISADRMEVSEDQHEKEGDSAESQHLTSTQWDLPFREVRWWDNVLNNKKVVFINNEKN